MSRTKGAKNKSTTMELDEEKRIEILADAIVEMIISEQELSENEPCTQD